MRSPGSHLSVIACLMALAAAGAAGAEDAAPMSVEGEVLEPLEVHIWTPPAEQLKGPDIRVETWSPERDRSSQIIDNAWVPGEPSRIRVIDTQNADPSRIRVDTWSPRRPSDADIVVHRWEPGRPSAIRVHGAY
jgi:hypothetical protein